MLENYIYYMKLNMQYVLVLDGNVCGKGCLGYDGNCYMLYIRVNDVPNFSDARELCVLHEVKQCLV